MIRRLFFTAALLLPGLAYGGNPSLDLSVPVPVASIACDQGPNVASIPAPAQAAGFTHCALNADFTDASGTTTSGGWVMNNPATWNAQCGATGNAVWHLYFNDQQHSRVTPAPCNRVIITTDPSTGGQVLDQQYRPTDYNGGNTNDILSLTWPGTAWTNGGGPNNKGLWGAMYAEITFRIPVMNVGTGHTLPDAYWIDQCAGCSPTGIFVETDFFESDTNSPGANLMDTHQPSDGGFTWNTNLTQYHTVGTLITSDGSSNQWICSYLDGNISSATPTNCFKGNVSTANMGILSNWIGNATCYQSPAPSSTCWQANEDVYIKSIRLFECSNYWNAECTGTLITH
jgi:hypothetical protein